MVAIYILGKGWPHNGSKGEEHMTKDEALKLALKFVEDSECGTADLEAHIKEALEQPEQEPQIAINSEIVSYVAPQREWVGLTEDEVNDLYNEGMGIHATIEATEAKLKDKNHDNKG
jgi:hypothetical protein